MPTETPMTFGALGVADDLCARLTRARRTEPFPIQAAAIHPALAGKDVCGRAPTGSGKTLGFGLPIAQRVGRAKPARPKALVLAPTRELAAQITTELKPLLAVRKRSVASFYGGVGFGPQLKALRRGVDVAVGCPGRIADLVKRGDLVLEEVDIVVIDEADRMADMGFLPEVRRLLDRVRPRRQTLLFSATLDGDIDVLVRNYQRNPSRHELAKDPSDGAKVTHLFWNVSRDQRVPLCAKVISSAGPTIVFCRTKRGADRVARQLEQSGLRAAAIHGDRSQSQRERALESFHRGQVDALVATDVAARGIHVDGVSAVVHLDPPADEKDYVHRSGRTGRAGADGVVVTFVAPELRKDVTKMQKLLKMTPGITSPDADGLPVLERPARKVRATPPRKDDAPRSARPGGPRTSRRTGAPRRGHSSDGPRGRDGDARPD